MTVKKKRTASQIGRSNVKRSKAHERQVANQLTKWSGALFRRRRTEGRDVSTLERDLTSDVIPVKGSFLYSVEAKCGEGFSFDALFASPKTCLFTGWWHQTCYDAQLASKVLNRHVYPMLFFRPAVGQNWVAVSYESWRLLMYKSTPDPDLMPLLIFGLYKHLGPIGHNVSHTKNKNNKKIVELELDNVVFCRWKDFAKHISPAGTLFG